MLEVEPTGHRGHMTTGSGRNGIDLEKIMSSICSWLMLNTNMESWVANYLP